MTSQTPASKASSGFSLLAFSSNPPPATPQPGAPQPARKDDFLSVILRALTERKSGDDNSSSADKPSQPSKEKPAPAPAPTPTPEAVAASALLAWLIPPLPIMPRAIAPKSSGSAARPAAAVASDEAKSGLDHSGLAPHFAKGNGTTLVSALHDGQEPPPTPAKGHDGKATPPIGTSAANTKPGMSFNTERNEIAARKEQKLPVAPVTPAASADSGSSSPDSGAKMPLPLPFAWHEAPSEQLPIADFSVKAAAAVVAGPEAATDIPLRAASATPMDRLEQMISREAVTFKQIGAQTLNVSLKVDANTQLFLQLTNNNGAVQASLRCERGQFTAEDSQWAQLRQSLATQNIDLQPMNGASGSNLSFEQPAGQHSRQSANREDWPTASSNAVQPAQQRKQQKQQNRSRKNWESWA